MSDLKWLSPTHVMVLERKYERPELTLRGIASLRVGREIPLFQHSVVLLTI